MRLQLAGLIVMLLVSFSSHAARLKPYSLALKTRDQLSAVATDIQARLKQAGFDIVGTYQPYRSTQIFVITSDALKREAAKTRYGGFGAVLKVAITEVQTAQGQEIQIAYNNPNYVGLAYNMDTRLELIKQQLQKAVGYVEDFGGEGIEESRLPDYNYTFGLEGFFGFMSLVDHGSQQKALQKVEQGLASNKFGIGQVYRVDIPGKQQTIFGLSLNSNAEQQPYLNDQFVMEVIDHQHQRRSAHLPYEIMVDNGKVLALHPHFRLAVNFPDLHMFGEHSFGRLMDLPYVYEEYFTQVVGGQWPPEEDW